MVTIDLKPPCGWSPQLLWQGDEAVADALELVGVAEAAAARAALRCSRHPSEEHSERFVWQQPLMRPAGNAQQVGILLLIPFG